MLSVGIDIGQTGVRLGVGHDAPREAASDGAGGGSVADVVRAVERLGAKAPLTAAYRAGVGVTGDYDADDLHLLARGIRSVLGVREVRLSHDSVTALLGAVGPQPAVVTMCGTGAVTLAFDGRTLRRYDGFGALGDWGGGSALGLAGVRAGLRAIDGVGPATSLTDPITARWASPAALFDHWRKADPAARAFVSGFARSVAQSAESGDRVAQGLILNAARGAAATTIAAARSHQLDTISYSGAILRQISLLQQSWRDTVRESLPEVRIVTPAGDGLAGAQHLLALGDDELTRWHVTSIRA